MDVNGVGYELEAPMNTFYQLPDADGEVELLTHLVVREDAHTLYGFSTEDERYLFRTLIRVNGIGAKMALAILSGISTVEFRHCIETDDDTRLMHLPGVGKKTAQRLIVEMRDRLDGGPKGNRAERGSRTADAVSEAVSALISLGYPPQQASRLVRGVVADGSDGEALIRAALKAALR